MLVDLTEWGSGRKTQMATMFAGMLGKNKGRFTLSVNVNICVCIYIKL